MQIEAFLGLWFVGTVGYFFIKGATIFLWEKYKNR